MIFKELLKQYQLVILQGLLLSKSLLGGLGVKCSEIMAISVCVLLTKNKISFVNGIKYGNCIHFWRFPGPSFYELHKNGFSERIYTYLKIHFVYKHLQIWYFFFDLWLVIIGGAKKIGYPWQILVGFIKSKFK